MKKLLEQTFELRKNQTTIKKEIMAGIITFLTMSYILIVNPNILSETGMDKGALFTATILATIVATLLMGLYAKLPIAQAPGMGLNNFFAFTVVLTLGYSWQFALTAVFVAGLIFLLLTLFNVRELIVKTMPQVLKDSIPVGIGLFITIVGLKSAGIIVSDSNTLVKLGDFTQPNVWIACLGLLLTGILLAKKWNGAILIGIITTTVFGFAIGYVQAPASPWISLPPSLSPLFGQALKPMFTAEGWQQILSIDMAIVVFTFLFVNLLDTVGTLIGVISKTDIADEEGNFPQMKKALFSDAIGTTVGAIFGTSSVTSYVESAAGVAAGGRTGLTALSVCIMFFLSLFLSPIFLIIPAAATAPALIIVGLFMVSSVVKIDFEDITNGLPTFITLTFIPFCFSIADGIVFGILSYVALKLGTGKFKEISPTIYFLAGIFLIKLLFLDS